MEYYNGVKVDGMEDLCIYLKHFAYPCRYSDTMPRFGRDISQLSMISNLVMNFFYENHKHCLENLCQGLFFPLNLQLYADGIPGKGHLCIIVGVLLTEQYALFVDHRKCRE